MISKKDKFFLNKISTNVYDDLVVEVAVELLEKYF